MSPKGLIDPPEWTKEELEEDRLRAIEDFRRVRMEEPLEAYLEAFELRQAAFEDLLESTVDLTQLSDHALTILTDPRLLEALRYLAGPPISLDDLKVVANVPSLSSKQLKADPSLAQRLIDTVLIGVDRQRFPWLHEQREPTEEERRAAVLASAAMLASQRVAIDRRSESKTEQENRVEAALLAEGFTKVPTRTVNTSAEAPGPGEFCRESTLAGRKADVLVGLWDTRLMPIECKVSNSGTNSIKRLNNDAAVKAVVWRGALGSANVVPTAVLSGVYKLKNLIDAQDRGLTLFWAHDLAKLTDWIAETVPGRALRVAGRREPFGDDER
jgi:hypothetical protein